MKGSDQEREDLTEKARDSEGGLRALPERERGRERKKKEILISKLINMKLHTL